MQWSLDCSCTPSSDRRPWSSTCRCTYSTGRFSNSSTSTSSPIRSSSSLVCQSAFSLAKRLIRHTSNNDDDVYLRVDRIEVRGHLPAADLRVDRDVRELGHAPPNRPDGTRHSQSCRVGWKNIVSLDFISYQLLSHLKNANKIYLKKINLKIPATTCRTPRPRQFSTSCWSTCAVDSMPISTSSSSSGPNTSRR